MTQDGIRAALADMQQTRKACDDAIRNLERVLALKDPTLSNAGTHEEHQQQHLSYVQLAISVLKEIGRPTPITVLLDRIRERRNDQTITRGSVETSLLRYLTAKGAEAGFVKPCPGTYAVRTPSSAASAASGR